VLVAQSRDGRALATGTCKTQCFLMRFSWLTSIEVCCPLIETDCASKQ